MVNFGDALRKGLRFCIEPKRWLPLFVLDAVVFGALLAFLLGNMDAIVGTAVGSQQDLIAEMSLAPYFAGMLAIGIMWFIARIWIIGSIIHQSIKPREVERGYRLSLGRLHKLLAAAVIVAIASSLAGFVPFLGFVISIVISWAFFFMLQGIVIDNLGAISTLKNSWGIFRKDPLDVFIAWLLISIVSASILGVFSLPLMIALFGFMLEAFMLSGSMEAGFMALLMVYVQENMVGVVALGLLSLVGLEISQVFGARAQTEFYLQLKKRFPSILKSLRERIGRFF